MRITDEAKTLDAVDSFNSTGIVERPLSQTELELHAAFGRSNNKSCSSDSHESISPTETVPFNIDGLQTVVNNNPEHPNSNGKFFENGESANTSLHPELRRCREENVQLRAALKEASLVNQQWRIFHDQRQGYVEKFLFSLQDIKDSNTLTQGSGWSSVELKRLRETFSRQQKKHNEHIQLMEMQVRAHRDDWEAERSEKESAEINRIQAETQMKIVQQQLEYATTLIEELEGRLKQCKCPAAAGYNASGNSDRKVYLTHSREVESASGFSPSICSTNSLCTGTSRSSSVSKDLSASTSPTISKNLQSGLPYCINIDGSTGNSSSLSPTARCSFKLSSSKTPEKFQEKNLVGNHSCLPNSENNQDKLKTSHTKSLQVYRNSGASSPPNGTGKEKTESSNGYSPHNYDSKGARPKYIENEIQAKHRARSILASALPISPSSSKPNSPVTVAAAGKGSHLHNIYVQTPSTGTKANTKCKVQTSETQTNEFDHSKEETTYNRSPQMGNGNSTFTRVESTKSRASTNSKPKHNSFEFDNLNPQQLLSETVRHTGNVSPNCKVPSHKISSENLVNGFYDDQVEKKQSSSIQIDDISCQTSCSNCLNCTSPKPSSPESRRTKESFSNKDLMKVKTASQKRQNTKSLTVTNSQQEKFNTNYASITVMPGPSSALYSHTQTTSTTSSRSSSPGISLTTFALNANGQGVPGAIYFALGSETKSPKSSQTNVSILSAQEEVISSKTYPTACKQPIENGNNERIVNSAWVQLMDKENNSLKEPSKTSWRTARAVPSHKLNSSRKTHQEDPVYYNREVTSIHDRIKQVEQSHPTYNCLGNKACSNTNNYLKPPQNYESKYQTSFSPPPTFISCSRASPSISISSPFLSQNDYRSSISPTICMIPHTSQSQLYPETELRTMASKNISSAILSYENKGCSNTVRKQCIDADEHEENKKYSLIGGSSERCLICPTCQKLFSHEHSSKYAQHLQICGGPKYVDM